MKPIRAVAVLPTLFTLGNLVCGFFAIVVLARIEKPQGVQPPSPRIELKVDSPHEFGEKAREFIESDDPTHNLMLCGALILLAMLFDAVDGQVARLSRVVTDFGGQLDSLCDLVSFGLAPATLDAAWRRLELTVDPVRASLVKSAEDAHRIGFIKEKPDLSRIYELGPLNDVLRANGRPEVQ